MNIYSITLVITELLYTVGKLIVVVGLTCTIVVALAVAVIGMIEAHRREDLL